jgi:Ca2+-binding RTX toxin-like protein
LNGVDSIAPGQSVIFIDSLDPAADKVAAVKAAFQSAWFGTNIPKNFVIGTYAGTGVGISTAGDAVNLFNAAGTLITGIRFGASVTTDGKSASFDNKAGLGSAAFPTPIVSALSVIGVNSGFLAADGIETGSPGTINGAPTAITFKTLVNTIAENTSTTSKIKVADVTITDDVQGTNNLSLSGTDAASFELQGTELFLKAAAVLNYDVKTNLSVTVNADDPTIGATPDVSKIFSLKIADANNLVAGTTSADKLDAGITSKFSGISDTVFTGSGNDTVDVHIGGALVGNNRIDTGSSNDIIFIADADRVFGSAGDDELDATDAKNYRVSGGAGNDTFYLGTNGKALGSDGNDKFFATSGNGLGGGGNIISGGAGVDQFWIANGDVPTTANTILDFQIGTDVIGFQGIGANATNAVLAQVGADTTVGFGGQTLAVLKGIQSSSLTLGNRGQFVFA